MTSISPPPISALGWCFDSIKIADKLESLTAWLAEHDLEVTWVTRTVHTQIALTALGLRATCLQHVIDDPANEVFVERRLRTQPLDDPTLAELFSYDVAAGRTLIGCAAGGDPRIAIVRAWVRLLDRLRPGLVLNLNGIPGVSSTLTALARAREIPVWFLENGLLPDTMVVDPVGVNAGAHLVDGAWRGIGDGFDDAVLAQAKKRREAITDAARSVMDHGDRATDADLRARLEIPPDRPIVLVPLQVESDTNVLRYSPQVQTMRDFIASVLEAAAPLGDAVSIVFKEHPKRAPEGDPELAALCRGEGGHGAGKPGHGAHHYVHDLALPSLLESAERVICLNSTVGLEALLRGKPVAALGRSTFANQGLTVDLAEGSAWIEGLTRFLSTPLEECRPAEEALDRFFAYLLSHHLFPVCAEQDTFGFRDRYGARLRGEAIDRDPGEARKKKRVPADERARLRLVEACGEFPPGEASRGRLSIAGSGTGPTAVVLAEWWKARFPTVTLDLREGFLARLFDQGARSPERLTVRFES